MRFLLSSMVAATMLIAISGIGSKAEAAAMTPGPGTLPAQTKNYTPVEKAYYRRYYRRGYYGYGRGYGYRPYYGYGYGYRPYGYYGYGWRPGISIQIGPRWGWGY